MADFRIPLPDEPDGLTCRELDWDRELSAWTLSEREYGSNRWDMGLRPSALDLGRILVFFRMVEPVLEKALAQMSPGECVMAHVVQTGTRDIVADLCPECGEHWLVYRYEGGGWRLYGRTCTFSWHRGNEVDQQNDPLLTALLSGSASS